jgi:hypothetical protein
VRSRQEILFRLRQELGNLAMLVRPPKLATVSTRPPMQHVKARATDMAVADSILEHRFPVLGVTIDTGATIDWRRDYLHSISTGTAYFRRIPYLDFSKVGDHKVVWELNRHQHLPVLAEAYRDTGRREYLDEAFRQIESWIAANPYLRGINWASALEVGFRALSWGWFWEIAGPEMPDELRERFLNSLYRHGRFLETNLSVYFSPNTHLLGEAVALHALGVWFPEWPRSRQWRETGRQWVEDAMRRQVREDGSHFEQSVYYHGYALDFFRLYRSMAPGSKAFDDRLEQMEEFLRAMIGPSGILPLIGDDDGGRVRFRRPGTGWRAESRLFRDSGFAVMAGGDVHVVIKAGGFGEGSGGHSHSDVLSLVARIGDREILIDSGTYSYLADPVERERFRGSAAHNTVRIDGRDQAIPAGPFRWLEKPVVKVHEWTSAAECDSLEATCAYGGFVHRRKVLFQKPDRLVISDSVEGPPGEHTIEQFWHLGSAENASRLSFSAAVSPVETWRSRAFATKEKAPGLVVTMRGPLPLEVTAIVDLSVRDRD